VGIPPFLKKKSGFFFLIFLASAASFLLFYGLDSRLLWQDEAQTALVAKTILAKGVPMITDGVNSFSQEFGAEAGPDGIYKWHPWLPFYMTAASYKLLGINTFSAKFPFALLGVLTIILVYFFAVEATGNKRAAVIASVLILASANFLVMAKQCRYYSPVMFFTVLGLHEYLKIINGSRKNPFLFMAALVMLFYSQNVNFGILAAAVLLHAVFTRREKAAAVAGYIGAAALFCVPWLFYINGINYREAYPDAMTIKQLAAFVPGFLAITNIHIFPLALLLIPVAARYGLKKANPFPAARGTAALLIAYFLSHIVIISFFSVGKFYRYLAPLLPLSAVVTAIIIEGLLGLGYAAARWGAVLALAFFASPAVNYLDEITHEFNGPVKCMSEYIKRNARPGDIAAVSYENLPVAFYTGIRVIGSLEGGSLEQAKDARWIALRKHYIMHGTPALRRYVEENIRLEEYRRIELDCPDIPFENRESPDWHLFRSVINEEPVVLYEKR